MSDWADYKAFVIMGGENSNPSLEACFCKPIREEIAKALDEAVAAERESCCAAIRDACPMCDDGRFLDDPSGQTECEYCGRPMEVIRTRCYLL